MNTNIEILNLEGNAIDEDGAVCLTKVLRENFFITELVRLLNKKYGQHFPYIMHFDLLLKS